MDLKQKLEADFKVAMKSREKIRLDTIKGIRSEIRNAEIEKGEELDESEIQAILAKEAKKREEAIEQYEEGGRPELAEKEENQLTVIRSYLPEPLATDELKSIVEEAIAEVDASDMSDMGAVMGKVMPQVRGRADGNQVNEIVREKLS